jgi:hypothetical protein
MNITFCLQYMNEILLGRPRCKREGTIKMDCKQIECGTDSSGSG